MAQRIGVVGRDRVPQDGPARRFSQLLEMAEVGLGMAGGKRHLDEAFVALAQHARQR